MIPTDKSISRILYGSVKIPIRNEHPIEVSTDAGMAAVLSADNVGRCYLFTGASTNSYSYGSLYEVVVEE